jgi:predicted ribosome quality control (RQC) complex YloA/Tae2 family protein
VVGRNKEENDVIKALAIVSDFIIEVKDYVGPTCVLRCKNYDNSLFMTCAAIAARYSDAPKHEASKVSISSKDHSNELMVMPVDNGTIEMLRI